MYFADLFRRKPEDDFVMLGFGRWGRISQEKPDAHPLQKAQEGRTSAIPLGGSTTVSPTRKSALPPPTYARKVAQPTATKRNDVEQERERRRFLSDIMSVAPHGSSDYDTRSLDELAEEYGIHKSTASRWQKHLEDHCLISRVKVGRRWARRATAMAEDHLA